MKEERKQQYTIGELSKLTGISVTALRYYVSMYRGVIKLKTDNPFRLGEFQSHKDGVFPFFLQLHNIIDSGWCLCIGRFSLCSVLL